MTANGNRSFPLNHRRGGAAAAVSTVCRSRPVHYQDVFATLYHNLGIDLATTTINDPNGRPQHLLEHGQVLRELV